MIDYSKYISDATRTESLIDEQEFSLPSFVAYMKLMATVGNILDTYKRCVFYKKPLDQEKLKNLHLEAESILKNAATMMDTSTLKIDARYLHAVIGIATEAGELVETIINSQSGDIDKVNIMEEFGDLNWYQAIALDHVGLNLEDILEKNISKLKARFPEKFSTERAYDRNLHTERQILEGK